MTIPDDFNPRSREGSDTIYSQIFTTRRISIRAPARGATQQDQRDTQYRDFNPRSREGSDASNDGFMTIPDDFNPRSREGSDGSHHATECGFYHFNPRSREGSDDIDRICKANV